MLSKGLRELREKWLRLFLATNIWRQKRRFEQLEGRLLVNQNFARLRMRSKEGKILAKA